MKDISLIERHFEKLAVVLVALLIGSYLVWDFLDPTVVKMGAQHPAVTPNEVNQILVKQAAALEVKQKSEKSTLEFEPFESGSAKKSYVKNLQESIVPAPQISKNSPRLAANMSSDERSGDTWYHTPQFAAATMLNPVSWYSDGLQPDATAKNKPLQEFIDTNNSPNGLDVIWTKPIARVDLKAIRNELAKENKTANPPLLAAPSTWRNNAIYFVDVVFERQEKNRDGTWTKEVTVPAMFGRKTFRQDIQSDDKGKLKFDANNFFVSMRGEQSMENEIRQPNFYPSLYGTGKSASTAVDAAPGEQPVANPANKKKLLELEKSKEELNTMDQELQDAGGEWDDEIAIKEAEAARKKREQEGSKGGGSSGGGGGGGLGGGAGAGSMGSPSGGDSPSKDKSKRKILTEKTRTLRAKVKKMEKELGLDLQTQPTTTAAAAPIKPAEQDLDFIDVWTHDLTATPGKTFRYRCRVEIFNPFFGKKRQLVEQQKKLSDIATISTAISDWSAPVRVPLHTMYYAEAGVIGDPAASSARQSASFCVYTLKNGLWHTISPNPSFEPGQSLVFHRSDKSDSDTSAASNQEIDTGCFLVDIVDDPNASPEKQRATLPGVILSRRDGTSDLEIRYPTREKLDADQLILKNLLEEAKSATLPVKTSGL